MNPQERAQLEEIRTKLYRFQVPIDLLFGGAGAAIAYQAKSEHHFFHIQSLYLAVLAIVPVNIRLWSDGDPLVLQDRLTGWMNFNPLVPILFGPFVWVLPFDAKKKGDNFIIEVSADCQIGGFVQGWEDPVEHPVKIPMVL
jgi:hypothetical protein